MLASNEKTLITLSSVLEDKSMIDEEVGEKIYHQRGKDGAKLLCDEMEKTIIKDPQAKSDIFEKMEKQKALHELIERIKESGLLQLQDSFLQHVNFAFYFSLCRPAQGSPRLCRKIEFNGRRTKSIAQCHFTANELPYSK